MLADYTTPTLLPTPPTMLDVSKGLVSWGVMGNDVHGDCTCAALGHLTQVWTGQTPSDQEVLALYALVNGGVDEGADMNTVLRTFRTHGFKLPSEKAHSFVMLHEARDAEIKLSLTLFEGVYIGVSLPLSAQKQLGQIWTPVPGPDGAAGSWGGHAINIVAYDPNGLTVVTWGALQKMDWAFFHQYCDEAFAVIPSSFAKKPPQGFDMKQLEADLKEITSA